MSRRYEYLPAEPFSSWISEQESIWGRVALAADLQVDTRTILRYKRGLDGEGNQTESFPRDHIENALHLAGYHLWDLYPDLAGDDAEVVEGYCSRCDEIVGIDGGQRCLWCSTPTSKPMSRRERAIRKSSVCPRCGGRKSSGGSLICRTCYGQPTPPSNKAKTKPPCPICGGPKVNAQAMRCAKCYRRLRLDTGKLRPLGTKKINEAQVIFAYELYDEHGFSVREVVQLLELDHVYASEHCAEHSIRTAWVSRGWSTRSVWEGRRIAEARRLYMCGKLPQGNRSGNMVRAKAR